MIVKDEFLIEIILEELNYYLESMCHDKDTGHFDKCISGNVYSMSDSGAKSLGIDNEKFVKRGVLTKDKKKGESPDGLKSPFGLNTSKVKQGGKIKMDRGSKISPKYSVSKYPKKYSRNEVIREIENALQSLLLSKCEDRDMNESSDPCAKDRRDSYQKGIQASLDFIRNYELSKKGE